jgi:hypothetical protein
MGVETEMYASSDLVHAEKRIFFRGAVKGARKRSYGLHS